MPIFFSGFFQDFSRFFPLANREKDIPGPMGRIHGGGAPTHPPVPGGRAVRDGPEGQRDGTPSGWCNRGASLCSVPHAPNNAGSLDRPGASGEPAPAPTQEDLVDRHRCSLTRRTAGLIPLLHRAQPNLRLEETRTFLFVLTGETTSLSALGRELRRQGLTRKRL